MVDSRAYFHKSLTDMEKAIRNEDWEKVKKILRQHKSSLDTETPGVERDIFSLGRRVTQCGEDISQISIMLASQMKGINTQNEMLAKVKSAINSAYFFERTIMHLIKKRKFME